MYTVSYNANGGTGAPSSQTKTHGVTLTLSSTKPTRSGYTFLGWSTSSSATSPTYYAGGSYTGNANVTLYAVWHKHTYDNDCDTTCNGCGETRSIKHYYINSCDIDCNVCGFVRKVEHTFTNECDGECDICYETRKAPHKYDGVCDGECNLCGKKRSVPAHTYGDDLVCDECGHKNFVLGDIDGTGEVDLSDVNVISKYLAGWDEDVNEAALDVNGDGVVNLKDLVLLSQYVAGWDVTLNLFLGCDLYINHPAQYNAVWDDFFE